MSAEDFEHRLRAEMKAAFVRGAKQQFGETGIEPSFEDANAEIVKRLDVVVAPLVRRLVDAEEAATKPTTVDAQEAAAWADFAGVTTAPDFARSTFARVVRPFIEAAEQAGPAPYVHGDPRVDCWELHTGGTDPRPFIKRPAADGFEPLAAWSPLCPAPTGFVWERPLRAVEVKP